MKQEGTELTTILGIETSFDDTAAAVVRDGREVLSNITASQIDLHREFKGVVPEIASRAHIRLLNPVIEKALDEAGMTLPDIDAVAVTYGPGLVGSLLVGVSTAKGLAYAANLPLYAINHIEAHIYAPMMMEANLGFPHVCMSAAGGHTSLYLVKGLGEYQLLGETRDDAAGEAFDKVSVAMGYGCPGGRTIEELSKKCTDTGPEFPRPMLHSKDYDFSFSGLKTAVVNYLQNETDKPSEEVIAHAFQKAAIEVLVKKTCSAARAHEVKFISLTGGVACNTTLFEALQTEGSRSGIVVFRPKPAMSTDNAAMIAGLAFHKIGVEKPAGLHLNADPSLSLVD